MKRLMKKKTKKKVVIGTCFLMFFMISIGFSRAEIHSSQMTYYLRADFCRVLADNNALVLEVQDSTNNYITSLANTSIVIPNGNNEIFEMDIGANGKGCYVFTDVLMKNLLWNVFYASLDSYYSLEIEFKTYHYAGAVFYYVDWWKVLIEKNVVFQGGTWMSHVNFSIYFDIGGGGGYVLQDTVNISMEGSGFAPDEIEIRYHEIYPKTDSYMITNIEIIARCFEYNKATLNWNKTYDDLRTYGSTTGIHTTVELNYINSYYSHAFLNPFMKLRMLYIPNSNTIQRVLFEIPWLYQGLLLNLPTPDDSKRDEVDEPRSPNKNYWTYDTYELRVKSVRTIEFIRDVDFYNDSVEVNFSVNFNEIEGVRVVKKYYYDDEAVKPSDLGRYKEWVIHAYVVDLDFNGIKNAIAWIISAVLLLVQFILYLATFVFNYLIMYLVMAIVFVWIWNVVIYWILWFFIFLGFEIYCFGVELVGWLWFLIVWLFDFLLNDVLPVVIELLIIIVALIIALLLWLVSLGNADFVVLYDQSYIMVSTIADFFIDSVFYFLENIVAFLLFIVLYILLTFLCLVKYWFTKAKGYTERSNQLKSSFEAYILPLVLAYNLIIKIKDMINPWS